MSRLLLIIASLYCASAADLADENALVQSAVRLSGAGDESGDESVDSGASEFLLDFQKDVDSFSEEVAAGGGDIEKAQAWLKDDLSEHRRLSQQEEDQDEKENKELDEWFSSSRAMVNRIYWDMVNPAGFAMEADVPTLPTVRLFAGGDRMEEIDSIKAAQPDLLQGVNCIRRQHIVDGVKIHDVAPVFAPNGQCAVALDTDQVGAPLAPPICIINDGVVTHDGKHIITKKEIMILTEQNSYYKLNSYQSTALADRLVVCSDYDGQSLSNFMTGCLMKLTTTFATYLRQRNLVKVHIKTDNKECEREPCRCKALSSLMRSKCAALRAIGLIDQGVNSRFIGGSPQAEAVLIGNSPLAKDFFYHGLYANVQRSYVRRHLAMPDTTDRLPLILVVRSEGTGWSRWSSQTKMMLKRKFPDHAVVEFDSENPPPQYSAVENRWRLCSYAEAVIAPAGSKLGADCDFANPGGIFVEVEAGCGIREELKQSAEWHSYLGLEHHHLVIPGANTYVQAKFISDYVQHKVHEANVVPVETQESTFSRETNQYPMGWETICEESQHRGQHVQMNGQDVDCNELDKRFKPRFARPVM